MEPVSVLTEGVKSDEVVATCGLPADGHFCDFNSNREENPPTVGLCCQGFHNPRLPVLLRRRCVLGNFNFSCKVCATSTPEIRGGEEAQAERDSQSWFVWTG